MDNGLSTIGVYNMTRQIFIGQFKNGKLLNQIGKGVTMPTTDDERLALISVIDYLVTELDKYYVSINGEYIAYDFRSI